jgi:hypothetical protein
MRQNYLSEQLSCCTLCNYELQAVAGYRQTCRWYMHFDVAILHRGRSLVYCAQ